MFKLMNLIRGRQPRLLATLAVTAAVASCAPLISFLADKLDLRGAVEGACIYYAPPQVFYTNDAHRPTTGESMAFTRAFHAAADQTTKRKSLADPDDHRNLITPVIMRAHKPRSCISVNDVGPTQVDDIIGQNVIYEDCISEWAVDFREFTPVCPFEFAPAVVGIRIDASPGAPIQAEIVLINLEDVSKEDVLSSSSSILDEPMRIGENLVRNKQITIGQWQRIGSETGKRFAEVAFRVFNEWQQLRNQQ